MREPMHLLIPFASALSQAGTHTLADLNLPHLARLLGRLAPTQRLGTDEYSLTPPHERALASAWGWQGDDGTLPFAARAAAADGIEVLDQAWALLTPVHWHVGRDHVTLADPARLALDEAESRALFDAVRELFESEGFVLAWGAPLRRYASHESLADLPSASIDRVIGRNVDHWMPNSKPARLVRRLQNEVQMLLYPHALNEGREAADRPTVNSFWLSGCGRHQADIAGAARVDDSLRAPLLGEDWVVWGEAWRALDSGPLADLLRLAERGAPVTLTLCGERFAQRFESAPRPSWKRWAARWTAPLPHTILEPL
jgi:hypothetical protein